MPGCLPALSLLSALKNTEFEHQFGMTFFNPKMHFRKAGNPKKKTGKLGHTFKHISSSGVIWAALHVLAIQIKNKTQS